MLYLLPSFIWAIWTIVPPVLPFYKNRLAQDAKPVKNTNFVLAIIMEGIETKTRHIAISFQKSVIYSYLEYCVLFWLSHLKKDIIELWKNTNLTQDVMAVILPGFKGECIHSGKMGLSRSFSPEDSMVPLDGDTMAPNTCCRKIMENYIFILYLQVSQNNLVGHKDQKNTELRWALVWSSKMILTLIDSSEWRHVFYFYVHCSV